MKLKELIQQYDITIHFQPIISTVNKKVIGYEALTRGTFKGHYVSPLTIFEEAKKHHINFSFDKYVRSLAIRKFTQYYQADTSLLLFLNFESSLIDNNIPFEEFNFYNVCKQENIPPSNVVLEIREDKVSQTRLLEKFCQYYKAVGFNIALDDFGIGNSTFDRLSQVKPDIVKIDRSIIQDVNKNFINSEILKAINNMCYKIGAIVLAEGVETEKEILKCKKNDISIYQGYYFAKPTHDVETIMDECNDKIEYVISQHSSQIKQHQLKKAKLQHHSMEYCNYVIESINKLNIDGFNNKNLQTFIEKEINLEALYLIDYESAKQIGETIISGQIKKFYSPAKDGDCHYLKDYYYFTKNSKEQSYLSPKYISKATGNMCRTFAKHFTHKEQEYILCLDMKT